MAHAGPIAPRPKVVLVVGPAWVGDMVLAQPLVATLVDTGATVHVLAPVATAPVAERMPGVDTVHRLRVEHGRLGLGERRRVGRALRAHRFAQAFVLPNTFKSALVPWFARVPRRTGWLGEHRYGVLNDARRLDPVEHPRLVERYAALAGGPCRTPELRADPGRLAEARERLRLGEARPVVALCPGAAFGPAKRWPVEHFAEVAAGCARDGKAVWLFGSAEERPLCEDIAARVPETVNLAGRTDLATAIDLLSAADCVVANDSGLMHVAAALGRPVIALFGSTSPDFTPPLGERAVVLREPQPCSPCFQRDCPLGHLRCLVDLPPARVLGKIAACMSC